MSDTYTFKACDGVTGTPTAFLPQMQGTQISFEMSDVGSIGFDYYKAGINASLLQANRVEIATFLNGVEMDDGRFVIQSDSDDELEPESTTKYNGVSLLNMLKGALVYSADGSVTLGVDQTFVGATAGGILKALFDQNAARGTDRVMDRITYSSFSNTLDSAGSAWAFTIGEITYRVGVSYLDVIRNLVNNGMIEVKMVGRDLRVYNAGGLGVDKTIVSEPVVLRKGRDLTEAPRTRTREQVAAVALVVGNENVLAQFVDSSVGAAWGFDEVFISQGGISDPTTLGVLSQQEIERRSQIRIENTHKVALANSPWKPYVDYKQGDYIFTDRGNGPERLRIRQMILQVEDGGVTSASIVLNDRFLEREIVISRRVDGILGGASATGSVAIPVPPDPGVDLTIPRDPASLSSSSNVMVTESGRSVTAVGLSWPAVTLNTDGSIVSDLAHYETEYKTDPVTAVVSPSVWSPATDDTTMTRKFDRRSKPYGWLAGDGGSSVRTSGSKDFWLFADTFVGTADGSGAINSTPQIFIHNSMVITDPAVATTFDSRYGMGNLLSANDAFLETTIGLWQADTNCSVARDTTTFFYGAASLKITATAAGDAIARIAAPATSNYAVTGGKTYTAMAKAMTLSGTARNVVLGIRWYNSSNALIGTASGTSAAGVLTTYTRYNVVGVAPAGAVKAAVIITIVSAAAAQVFNCDTIGLMENDQTMSSWNDPNRGLNGLPAALVNPEDLGGAAIASGSLANAMFWTDDIVEISGKVYGAMTRYTPVGVFQSSIAFARWDGTTGNFEGVFAFTSSDIVEWGAAFYVSGGFLYIFGLDTGDPSSAQDTFLMRVPSSNVLGGTKEYLSVVGTGTWSTTRASAVAVYTGFANHINNIDLRGGVYSSIITIYGGGTLRRLTASNLWGPWTDTGDIYTQPNLGGGEIAYFPRIHSQFSDSSGILMSYSVNGLSAAADIRNYAPKFARGPAATQAAIIPASAYSAPRIIEAGVLTDNIGDIPAGWNFQARVRAVDTSGNVSIWRESAAIRTVGDTTAPNKPSTPLIAPYFQGVRVEWDGFDFQGGPPPSDWNRMEVHLSVINNFNPGPLTLYDTYFTRLGGVSPIHDLDYGQTYYARFVAVDVRGNRSLPSDVASATPSQLVNTAELGKKLIAGANIADSTIAVRSITVAAFDPSIVPNGGFEDEALNADGSGTGLPSYWSPSVWIIGSGGTVAYETAAPLAGTKSMKITLATAADGVRYASAKFPVTAGRLLAASVKVKASRAIANPAFELHIVCGNTEANTGAFPSAGVSVWGTSATITGTTGIQKLELQRIVDAGMTYAQVFVSCLNANDGSGWVGTFDEVEVRPVGGSAFIADASILNAKIANLAVDDAKVSNLSVGKLTAGTLVADITVSARIKTANTGARVELNSSGLQAYNSGGTQTVNIAASTGDATITGAFKTGLSGARLEMVDATDRTTIELYGTYAGDPAFMNSPTDGSGSPRIGINTGTFTYDGISAKHRLFMDNANGIRLGSYKSPDPSQTQVGYQLLLYQDQSVIARKNGAGVADVGFKFQLTDSLAQISRLTSTGVNTGTFLQLADPNFYLRRVDTGTQTGGYLQGSGNNMWIGASASGVLASELAFSDNGELTLAGKFLKSATLSGKAAIYCDQWLSVNLSGGGTVSYGTTMVSAPIPLFCMESSNLPGDIRSPTAKSTTGFSMITQNSVLATFHYWAFRTT